MNERCFNRLPSRIKSDLRSLKLFILFSGVLLASFSIAFLVDGQFIQSLLPVAMFVILYSVVRQSPEFPVAVIFKDEHVLFKKTSCIVALIPNQPARVEKTATADYEAMYPFLLCQGDKKVLLDDGYEDFLSMALMLAKCFPDCRHGLEYYTGLRLVDQPKS